MLGGAAAGCLLWVPVVTDLLAQLFSSHYVPPARFLQQMQPKSKVPGEGETGIKGSGV